MGGGGRLNIRRAFVYGFVGFMVAANIGVCVWAVWANKPHHFLTSAMVAILLCFQVAMAEDRRRQP